MQKLYLNFYDLKLNKLFSPACLKNLLCLKFSSKAHCKNNDYYTNHDNINTNNATNNRKIDHNKFNHD